MGLSITFFGPRHYWWKQPGRVWPAMWYHKPDKWSTGGIGFCIPFLHICFTWGRDHG